MSDTDGKWTCDMYSSGDADCQFWKNMIPLKDDFQTVNFTSAVCQALQYFVATSLPFHKKFLAVVPVCLICCESGVELNESKQAKYKACIQRYCHTVRKELGKVVETYCSEA